MSANRTIPVLCLVGMTIASAMGIVGCGKDGITNLSDYSIKVRLINGDSSGGKSISIISHWDTDLACNANPCTLNPQGSRELYLQHISDDSKPTFTAERNGTVLASASCTVDDDSDKEVIWVPVAKGSDSGTLLCGAGWKSEGCTNNCSAPAWQLEPVSTATATWHDSFSDGSGSLTINFPQTIHPGDIVPVSIIFSATVTYHTNMVGTERFVTSIGEVGRGVALNRNTLIGTSTQANPVVTGTDTLSGYWTVPAVPTSPGNKYIIPVQAGFTTHNWSFDILVQYSKVP